MSNIKLPQIFSRMYGADMISVETAPREGVEEMSFDLKLRTQQGWQCPVCNYVYSPITPWCYNCNRPDHEKTTITAGTTVECNHDFSQGYSNSAGSYRVCSKCGKESRI